MSIGRHVCKLLGYAPALPTPFDENDAIDAAAFGHFCDVQISNGATALVVGGTTSEAPNLSREEHCRLVRMVLSDARLICLLHYWKIGSLTCCHQCARERIGFRERTEGVFIHET